MDAAGGIAAAYNYVSDTTNHPGLRYTGRLAGDPPGTMPQGEQVLATGAASNNSFLYGAYNQLTLDDGDGCTFFYTGERLRHAPPKLHTVILEPDRALVSLVWHTALPCHPKVLKLKSTRITLKQDLRDGVLGPQPQEAEP